MGCYDIVLVPCPHCGEKSEFQTKSGECLLRTFELNACPADVLEDVNRHSPASCTNCGTFFKVEFRVQPAVVLEVKSVVAKPEEI